MFLVPEARMVTERLTEAARKGITIYGSAAADDSFSRNCSTEQCRSLER